MAVKINAGTVQRGDLYHVDPFEIIVKEELRGRHTPPNDEQIIDMAVSMFKHNQRQAVECRKIEDNKLLLVAGFTRNAASRLIRKGFNDPDTGEFIQDQEFKLKVTITQANDEKAFINNIVENAHRNQTSAIDDSHNQNRLRERYGMSDSDITKLYQYKDTSKVGRLKRLLALPTEAQTLIHEGRFPIQAALDILDLDTDAQNEALQRVYDDCNGNGKVVAADIREHVRSVLNDDDKPEGDASAEAGKASKNKAKPRSMKEVKGFFDKVKAEHLDPAVQTYVDTMLMWLNGKRADKTALAAIDKLLDAERS